jgi:hypothetical protein
MSALYFYGNRRRLVTLRCVLMRAGARYCPLLLREGGASILQSLLSTPNLETDRPMVAELAAEVMQIVSSVTGDRYVRTDSIVGCV